MYRWPNGWPARPARLVEGRAHLDVVTKRAMLCLPMDRAAERTVPARRFGHAAVGPADGHQSRLTTIPPSTVSRLAIIPKLPDRTSPHRRP